LTSLTLLLLIVSMVLFSGYRGLQAEVAGRQQYIQQSVQLETLYRSIVNDLATLATRNRDDQVLAVPAAHGITVTSSPAPSSGSVTLAQPGKSTTRP
jgi:hypothetical protein